MAVSAYETALAQEGGGDGGGPADERRDAFAEQFALAIDVDAKRALIATQLTPGSADALYFGSLSTLLELQSLLDENRSEADEQALALLTAQKPYLESAVLTLRMTHCAEKRARRVQGRYMLLELEASQRLNRTREDLKVRHVP
jgi:hypothetical protein